MLGELLPCGGGEPVALLKPGVLVGRHRGCDVVLADATVSGRHCQLEYSEGYWLVRDLGSRNGTRVNGAVCQTKCLMPGDVLSVAKVRFTVVYTLQAERPPPETEPRPAVPVGSLVERAGIAEEAPRPDDTARKARPTDVPAGRPRTRQPERTADEAPPPDVRLGELVPCGGGEPIPLRGTLLMVGRDRACDVVLPCATVSARHCELEFRDGSWWVRDVGSRNGVFVNGKKCTARRLEPGSTLAISKHRYRVVYAGPRAEAPAPTARPGLWRRLMGQGGGLGAGGTAPGQRAGAPLSEEEDEPARRRYSLDDPDSV